MNDNHVNGTPPHPPAAPWERQPGESARAFAAFCLYRDLPPAERSLDEVCRRLAHDDGAALFRRSSGAHPARRNGRVSAWSSSFQWVARAQAWDQEKDRLGLQAEAEAVKEMRRQHAEEAVQLRRKALDELRKLAEGVMTPAHIIRFFVEATKVEIAARTGGNQPVPWQQGGMNDGRDFTLRTLQDPIAADLACQLLEQLAGGQAQPGGPGVARQPGTVAGPAPPGPAQPKAG
jgi:hypothetical protein